MPRSSWSPARSRSSIHFRVPRRSFEAAAVSPFGASARRAARAPGVRDADAREVVVEQARGPAAVRLDVFDLGPDVGRGLGGELPARARVEPRDGAERLLRLVLGDARQGGGAGEAARGEGLEGLLRGEDALGRARGGRGVGAKLQQEAFAQVARADAGRREALHDREGALGLGHRREGALRDLLEGRAQVARGVERADDLLAELRLGLREARLRQLEHQVLLQGLARGDGVEEELPALLGVRVVFVVAAVGVEVVRVGAEGGEALGLLRRGRSLAVGTFLWSIPGRTFLVAGSALAGGRTGHGIGILVEVALLGGSGRVVFALGVDGALGGVLELEDGIDGDLLPDLLPQLDERRLQQTQRLLHLRREGHGLRLALLGLEGEGHDE